MTHEAICWRLPGAANEQPPTGFEATLKSRHLVSNEAYQSGSLLQSSAGCCPKSYESQRS